MKLPFYTILPICTFWTFSLFLYFSGFDSRENIENNKNTVTFRETCIRMIQLNVLHVMSILPMEYGLSLFPLEIEGVRFSYLIFGILLLDTIEYFAHYTYHKIPFLYHYVHKTHHAMKTPWSCGALYNSFSESILTSGLIAICFLLIFRFTLAEFTYVTTLGIIWTCMDHCDYFDHLTILGRKEHHRKHHEINIECNYQQPFFTFWDYALNTKK